MVVNYKIIEIGANLIACQQREEYWVDYPEFDSAYEVSNYGRIRNKKNGKIIKQTERKKEKDCYLAVKLTVDKKHFSRIAHRVVCSSFYGYSELTVNHKNGVKKDNRPINLEYQTIEQQNIHAEKYNLRPYAAKRKIVMYNGENKKEFLSITDSVKYLQVKIDSSFKNIQSNITHVLNNRAKSAYGFYFKYLDNTKNLFCKENNRSLCQTIFDLKMFIYE